MPPGCCPVLDGNRIQAAPKIPCRDRAPGSPGGPEPAHGPGRHAPTAEVIQADGPLQPEVLERQHIRAQQIENQEHLGRPVPDASHLDQLGDHRFVVHSGPRARAQAAVGEVARKVGDILGLAPRQAAGTESSESRPQDLIGQHLRREREQALPHASRGFDRDLLADDRARQREKRLAARLERDARVTANDAREHRIASRQSAFSPIPVCGSGHRPGRRFTRARPMED